MYAIIKTGGKQYRVAPGDVIEVEKLSGEKGQTIEFPALAVNSGDAGISAGKDVKARVTGVVLGAKRGPKLLVFKFKRKKQYKRLTGHRQSLTRVQINEIVV